MIVLEILGWLLCLTLYLRLGVNMNLYIQLKRKSDNKAWYLAKTLCYPQLVIMLWPVYFVVVASWLIMLLYLETLDDIQKEIRKK